MLQVLIVVLAGVSLTVLLSFGVYSCKQTSAEPPRAQVAQSQPASKRQQLQDRLQELSRSEPPSELSSGAKCYKQARPPTTADYLCPQDGSRTQHTLNTARFLHRDLPRIQATLKDLPGVTLALDASEFCRKCKPEVTDPKLVLKVQMPGEAQAHETRGISLQDARILKAFLEGKDKYPTSYGREKPLKDQLRRVRTLLGIKDK